MYKFKLQPVLEHRETVEENLKKEVASCKTLLEEEIKKLKDFERSKSKLMTDLGRKKKESATISEILLYVGFIEQVTRDIEKQEARVSQIRELFNKKKEMLINAMKEKKSVEKLKEKEMERHRIELLKKDQNFLDEIALHRFHART